VIFFEVAVVDFDMDDGLALAGPRDMDRVVILLGNESAPGIDSDLDTQVVGLAGTDLPDTLFANLLGSLKEDRLGNLWKDVLVRSDHRGDGVTL
jgi:hypothetical protein